MPDEHSLFLNRDRLENELHAWEEEFRLIARDGIPLESVDDLQKRGVIKDGRAGGLILGGSHEERDVMRVAQLEGRLRLVSRVEGNEFVMTGRASAHFAKRLAEINGKYTEEQITRYTASLAPSPLTPLLDLRLPGLFSFRFLWADCDQFIVNRRSTAEHLLELMDMNLC